MWLNCNLGKVNLELMLPAVSPKLHMIGGAPLEFTGADHIQLCTLEIVADQCLCLRLFADSLDPPSLPEGQLDLGGK